MTQRTREQREDMAYAMGVRAALQRLWAACTDEHREAFEDCERMWQNRVAAIHEDRRR